jgi:hypothetical protein
MDMIPRPLSRFATIPSARLLFDLQLKACPDRCDALSEVSNALSSFAATGGDQGAVVRARQRVHR